MRLKVDNRIRTVLENAAATHHRALVVLVGEKSKDQVVFIHNIVSNTSLQQASVLWCYKKELSLSSNKKKRFRQIQAAIRTGDVDPNEDNLFEKFVSTTTIKYCYYKDTFRVLGNTFKMCVLQDFEGVTANTLCRVVETVEGGGCIVLLLQSLESLKQLYTLSMDVHARYRTFAHSTIVPRFNERLLQSLSTCPTCIIIDDHLRVVPHSAHVASLKPLSHKLATAAESQESTKLVALKKSVADSPPVGKLVELCKTLDQAKVVLQFSLCITEKLLRTTVSLTAARGRGKSAAMGLAIAGAVAFGYSKIYVTSPSPENLKTLFEFLETGLQAVGYEEKVHYTVMRSADPDLHKCVTRLTVMRDCTQVIQYITPEQSWALGQAELLVIDEAAAIPLPLVRALLGPYLVFLSSTVAGYEGTGRSLALKLIAELRQEADKPASADDAQLQKSGANSNSSKVKRKLVELTLKESIRYRSEDPVEAWLSALLCLEPSLPPLPDALPAPEQCQLCYVNRDVLFSYSAVTEEFLGSIQSLLVSSHYRNSPDDLQQLSDAPAHHLFVLLPPHSSTTSLPPVLVVLQVVLEGGISKSCTMKGLSCSDGERPAGDLIPWTVSNAFQNYEFPQLSGARVLRIATHPSAQGRRYGTRAVQLLQQYYASNCHLASVKELALATLDENRHSLKVVREGELLTIGKNGPKEDSSPPLLIPLAQRPAEAIHYLGVAYGITQPLFNFWKQTGFTLVYLSQECSSVTGESTVIMLQQLKSAQPPQTGGVDLQSGSNTSNDSSSSVAWLETLWHNCKARLPFLISSNPTNFSCQFALSLLTNKRFKNPKKGNTRAVRSCVSMSDVHRLSDFTRHQCEAAFIRDLFPAMANLYFCGHIRRCKLKSVQAAVLCGLGLLNKTEADIAEEFSLSMAVVLQQKRDLIATLHQALKTVLESEEDEEATQEAAAAAVAGAKEAAEQQLLQSEQQTRESKEDLQDLVQRHLKRSDAEQRALDDRPGKKRKKLELNELKKPIKLL